MKIAKEVYEEVYYMMAVADDGPLNYPQIIENAMKEYARMVIDEMVSRGDKRENSLIYSEGEYDVASNTYDALYNYDKIDEFKKSLK